ncbi:hypothetical protein N7495_001247 [Penicillium taxi]|uniref:uncharacterized protein n=1 Tax=Penicillium taxi TaxID=168475 RepID=UPI002545B9D2|nr:uncharacterized protein N7495_001247 [Penicillium taxi]KAJ5908565.1 hypothetical protein N7495_001247 [Penicillium taxi]
MMDATYQSPTNSLPPYTKVPIAQLSPTLDQQEEKCINATVTLIWPYSSVTKTLSLLLAEPDSRLRRSHGQVKAIFHDHVAKRIAESHIGIGDNVCLALKGARLSANDTVSQTPGRYIGWDIHFETELSIEQNATDASDPPNTPKNPSAENSEPLGQATWASGSPAYLKSSPRFLFGGLGHLYSPSLEDDGFVPGKGRKRPRYSLQRDDWHIVEEAFSPEEELAPLDWWETSLDEPSGEEIISEDASKKDDSRSNNDIDILDTPDAEISEAHGPSSQEQPPVFIKPSLKLTGDIFGNQVVQSNNASTERVEASLENPLRSAFPQPTDTPQLRPIPSPALPIPSPLISTQNGSQEYFSSFHAVSQSQSLPSVSMDASTDHITSEPNSLVETPPTSQPQTVMGFADVMENVQQNDGHSFLSRLFGPQHVPPTISSDNLMTPAFSPTFFWPSNFGTSSSEIKQESVKPGFEMSQNDPPPAAGSAEGEHKEIVRSIESETAYDDDAVENDEFSTNSQGQDSAGAIDDHSPIDVVMAEGELDDWNSEDVQSEDEAAEESQVQKNQDRSQSSFSEDEGSVTDNDDVHHAENIARDSILQYDDEERAGEEVSELEYDDEEAEDTHEEYDEDVDEEDEVEMREEDDEIQSEAYSDESEASDLPQLPPSQPEVILLDSDSDDELASDQPPLTHPLLQESKSDRRLSDMYVHSESGDEEAEAEWDVDGDSQDESLGDEEPEEGEAEDSESDDELHTSKKEDDSSVDVLTQDQYLATRTSREPSAEEGLNQTTVDAGASTPDDELVSDTGIKAAVEPDSISLDFNEASPLQDSSISEDSDEGNFLTPSQGIITSLDDVSDRNLNDSVSRSERGNLSDSEQGAKNPSAGIDDPQLLTPDPTYEAAHDSQWTLFEKKTTIVPTSDLEMDTSQPPSMEGASQADLELAPSPLETDGLVPKDLPGHELAAVVATIESDEGEQKPDHAGEESSTQQIALVGDQPSPNRHAHGLRSKLSYFAPLAALIDHYNALVDTISIVHDISPIVRATSGPKDWYMTIQLTDPTMAGTVLRAQVFRRYKNSLPSVTEGNAILLRNFKVRSYEHTAILVSVETSSWAVFDGSGPDAKISGPPVEYGAEERAYSSGLRKWYNEIGTSMISDQQLQASIARDSPDRQVTPGSVALSEAGSFDSNPRSRGSTRSPRGSRRSRKSNRRITIHELRDGTRYTEVGSPSSKEDIHELRDGTVYANL